MARLLTCVILLVVSLETTLSTNRTNHCKEYRKDGTIDCTNVNLTDIKSGFYPVNYVWTDHLYLCNNGLAHLNADVFDNLTNLTFLEIRNNLLETLHPLLFSKLEKLYYLFLNNNKLKSLNDSRIFSHQKYLIKLYLHDNELISLGDNVFQRLPKTIKQISLYGNPLNCNCKLKRTMLWCVGRNLSTGAACYSPSEVKGLNWTVLHSSCNFSNSPTQNNSASLISVISFAAVVVCVSLIVTVYYWRRKLRKTNNSKTSRPASEHHFYDYVIPTRKTRLSVILEVTDTSMQSNNDLSQIELNGDVQYEELYSLRGSNDTSTKECNSLSKAGKSREENSGREPSDEGLAYQVSVINTLHSVPQGQVPTNTEKFDVYSEIKDDNTPAHYEEVDNVRENTEWTQQDKKSSTVNIGHLGKKHERKNKLSSVGSNKPLSNNAPSEISVENILYCDSQTEDLQPSAVSIENDLYVGENRSNPPANENNVYSEIK